jgi:transcriptional regulator with XRE-family HTH domain
MYTIEAVDAADLGRAIRRLRKQRGWTQAVLAEWLGVHPITVGRMERGASVAVTVAMRAISLLGAKAVVVPKGASVEAIGEEPPRG